MFSVKVSQTISVVVHEEKLHLPSSGLGSLPHVLPVFTFA